MPTMSESGLVSVNGKVTPAEEAVLPALDRGFLFGDSIFETFVGFHDKLLDVDRHLARLSASAESVGIAIPWTDAELGFELAGLAEQTPFPKKNVRLVVTRGSGLGLRASKDQKPNKVVYCFQAAPEPRSTYEVGFALRRLVKASTERGAAPKTANYQKSIVGLSRAAEEGFQDILWTNADGEVTESSIANIFFVQREGDGVRFVTPAPMSGLLLGITRQTVIELLRSATLPVEERVIYADELARFDEAFLTSTVRGLVPVNRIDQHRLHTTRPNSVFQHVARLHGTWVQTQLGFRVDWATGERVPG
jgi:branched-subunit amino acid aminotransferase/4-amino-4-deoxychorismate lyase